jgi:hypothetical protein
MDPMTARISCPAKSATQSGAARAKVWLLEYATQDRQIEPLMGWTSSSDTSPQVKLWFATREEAVAYAEREGIAYRVEEPKARARRIMSYSDNFKTNRVGQWTH